MKLGLAIEFLVPLMIHFKRQRIAEGFQNLVVLSLCLFFLSPVFKAKSAKSLVELSSTHLHLNLCESTRLLQGWWKALLVRGSIFDELLLQLISFLPVVIYRQ